jgi:hypothetical protein
VASPGIGTVEKQYAPTDGVTSVCDGAGQLRQDVRSVDKDVITQREFTRLQGLLAARGVSETDHMWSFADVWAAASEWALTAFGDALSDEYMIGWQCSRNPNDRYEDHDHADPPEGVPRGPLFNVVFFWDFPNAGEVGVDLWYPADGEWEAVTLDPDWDAEHPINLHGWGYPGPRAAEFFAVVDASMQIDVASRKSPALLRVFRSGSPELVIRHQ